MVTKVTNDVLADNAVTTNNIADSAITDTKLAEGAVTATAIANASIDGTKIALGSDAQGDIMYYNGTAWSNLPAGNAGEVLQTNGPGANPSWGAQATASIIKLNGNNGTNISFTASQQVLTTTYFSQEFVSGSLSWDGVGQIATSESGVFIVTLTIYILPVTGNGNGRFQIRKNGSLVQLLDTGEGSDGVNSVSVIVNMAANEYIDVIADGFDLPTAYMGFGHSTFNMYKIG